MTRVRSKWVLVAFPAVIVLAMSTLGLTSPKINAAQLAGSQGTDTSLPATPSQVRVSGRGDFGSLRVTVNQTSDLVNQAVSVAWSGGTPTYSDSPGGSFLGRFGGDYMEMFQCWGDDDRAFPSNPGPPPQQCEYGGESADGAKYPKSNSVLFPPTRIIATPSSTCGAGAAPGCLSYDDAKALAASTPSAAYLDPTGYVMSPFRAVDGTLVPASVNYSYDQQLPYLPHDTNPYFSYNDTNEVNFSRTFPDGTGQELFKVNTGEEAPGLGCGQKTSAHAGSSPIAPKCWLVVVPRGSGAQESVTATPRGLVDTSPLAPSAWRNRIAIPLSFLPVGSSCNIGASPRRLLGSELASPATASWQPSLCLTPHSPPFSYSALPDDRARSLLTATGLTGAGAGMAVVTRPVDPASLDPAKPPLYAPLTLSGVAIGFNVQRVPALGTNGQSVAEEQPIAGRRVAKINLTPRLVAKLLTQSYRAQFYPGSPPRSYAWVARNPSDISTDPDFLAFNPEFTELRSAAGVASSGLVVEQQSADANYELWRWILADGEARAWLDGAPDPSGMRVNPYYSTSAKLNVSGTPFAPPPPSNFPKSDPYCWTPPPNDAVGTPPQLARSLCTLDWSPYVLSMRDAASSTRSANTGSRTTFNPGAPGPAQAWSADGPQATGASWVMSVTDTAHASRFGLQSASLSRAGDDGSNRSFVAPTETTLLAGEKSMVSTPTAGVRAANPATVAANAYPLTLLTYGVTIPAALDASARADYADYLAYAAGAGQKSGTGIGDLPLGYAPLPPDLRAQTAAASATLLNSSVSGIPPSSDAVPSMPSSVASGAAAGGSGAGEPVPATSFAVPASGDLGASASPAGTASGPSRRAVTSRSATNGEAAGGASGPEVAASTSPTESPVQPPPQVALAEPAARQRTGRTRRQLVEFAVPLGLLLGLLAVGGSVSAGRTGVTSVTERGRR